MKKNILLLVLLWMVAILPLQAQSPQAFSYQAVVRDASGTILPNQSVSLQLTILSGGPSGTTEYQETHNVTTNAFGLVNLEVGSGTVVSGSFPGINWGANSHFLQVELDATGGTNYVVMGTQQLLSVPYALHATTVENDQVNDADNDPNNEIQTLSVAGTDLSISGGNTVTLPGDADSDPNNELQNLSLSNDSILISGGTGVDLSGYVDTDDQTLSIVNDSLYIVDGNGVDLAPYLDNTDDQIADVFQLNGNNLELSLENDGLPTQTVDLSGYLDNTDDQVADVFQLSGSNLQLSLENDGQPTLSVDLSSLTPATYWTANGNDIYNSNTGNIGMGTSAPNTKLEVNGDVTVTASGSNGAYILSPSNAGFGVSPEFRIQSGETGAGVNSPFLLMRNAVYDLGLYFVNDNSRPASKMEFQNDGGMLFSVAPAPTPTFAPTWTDVMVVAPNGRVGVGTLYPQYKFQVGESGDGTQARANAWNTFSDRRWKTGFTRIPNAVGKIMALNGYYYYWKDKPDKSLQVGVVAQEVEAQLPEIVATDDEGYKSVDYSKMSALFIEAIKEQQNTIMDLQERLAEQEARMAQMQEMLERVAADQSASGEEEGEETARR